MSALGLQVKEDPIDTLAKENASVLPDGIYTIQSSINPNYVLDVANGSTQNGGNVQLYQNNDTNAQEFKVTHDSKGYVIFTNVKSGKVLDLNWGLAKNNSNIQQWDSNGSVAQKWIVKKNVNSYTIISGADTNYVLDLEYGVTANCQNIYLYKNNNTAAQQWYINPCIKSDNDKLNQLAAQNKNVLPDGTYTIKNNKNKNYVLDVLWASSSNNANIQLYLNNGSTAQAFKVTHDPTGYVTFTNLNSGKVIDVNMNKAELGQNIAQNESNGVKGQKWIVQKNGSGYSIISALDPDYVMDLAGGSIFSGGNIQLYENNNSDAQRWVFEKFMTDRDVCDTYAKENKNLMEDGTYYIKNKDIKYSIDISNGSLYSGANVQLNLLKRTNMQKWIITHDSMGYVSFKNMGTGMYLTANGNTKNQILFNKQILMITIKNG